MVEIESGTGRRFVWTVGCHPDWSDLPLRPLYVPLVFEMLKIAAAEGGGALPQGTVDHGFEWELPAGSAAGTMRIGTPSGGVAGRAGWNAAQQN